jgi:hypothetical protein
MRRVLSRIEVTTLDKIPTWIQAYSYFLTENEQFKYLGTTIINQNYINEEIKSRFKSRNTCHYSVRNLLSFSLISKNVIIKTYRNINLPIVLYGCETWSLTEHRLRVFENRLLRRICESKRKPVAGKWRRLRKGKFYALFSLRNFIRVIKSGKIKGRSIRLYGDRRDA